MNIQREISRNIPNNVPPRFFVGGIPILTAYGCALLERETGKSYVYTAVNLTSGKTEVLSRRANPLTTSGVETMVERLRKSSVVGAGRFEADRLFGEKIALAKCREMMITLFKEILPLHGYTVRAEQIALAEHILDAIQHRSVSLAEAEVGTGKTLAYLVPAILAKRGRLNGHWNMSVNVKKKLTKIYKKKVIKNYKEKCTKFIKETRMSQWESAGRTHGAGRNGFFRRTLRIRRT